MKKIFELGVSSDFEEYKNQSVKTANQLLYLMILLGGVLFAASLFFHSHVGYAVVFLFLTSAALGLNRAKAVSISRFLIVNGSVILLAYMHSKAASSQAPLHPGIYLLQFCFILIPWLIIDFRENILLASTFVPSLLIFVFQREINDGGGKLSDTNSFSSAGFQYLCYVLAIMMVVWALYNFIRIIRENISNLNKTRSLINDRSAEMEKRQEELQKKISEINETHAVEEKRSWVAQGVSQVIDLMRSKSKDLYPELVEQVVGYMEASVGAIYLIVEEEFSDSQLKLEGCYAFDRRKSLDISIPFGDGIIGQSCIDKEIFYFDNMPQTFLDLTSGLGDDAPKYLAVVPLMEEGVVAGVLEIASKNPFSSYQKEFLQQLSLSVASFILANSVNDKIKVLIEQNQSQAEEMKAQEEEMMQNMEELHATQEEMSRKEREYIKRIEELEKKLAQKEVS